MSSTSAYRPNVSARRPGGSPKSKPTYRVLVHRKYEHAWNSIVSKVGLQQAQQFWDHVAHTPGQKDPIAQVTILKGKAGDPKSSGWSRTYHYELSSMARINYQFHHHYKTAADGDPHPVVAILTISYSSH